MRDFNFIRRDAGLRTAVVPMGPQDPRLADLASLQPPVEEERRPRQPRPVVADGNAYNPNAPRREWRPRNGGGGGNNRYRGNNARSGSR